MADESDRSYPEQYMLRMPLGMRARLKEAAVAQNRSLNVEIVTRLEASFAEPELDPDVARRAAEVAERIVARVVERIEREPLPMPRVIQEQQKPESRLSDRERADLEAMRRAVGAENVELVEQRFVVARVTDPKSGAVSERPVGPAHGIDRARLDLDVAIVRRALGREDVDVPVLQGRVQLDLLPVEPMTRMMLATLLGYVDLHGTPVEPAKADAGQPVGTKLGPVKRKLLL